MNLAFLMLVVLTGLDKQVIFVNPDAVVSVRNVRPGEHLGKGIRCIVHTNDGKFISVVEDCRTVRARVEAMAQ